MACKLIKCNGFQIRGKISYETPYLIAQYITVKKWKLVPVFTRTSNLKLGPVNFDIFESSNYEKDWTFF